MICIRCQERIERDEEHERVSVDSASGARPTMYRHAEPCKAAPHQSAPDGPIRRR